MPHYLKNDILIIDNCVPEDTQVEIEQLCKSHGISWYYLPTSNDPTISAPSTKDSVDGPQFVHTIWNQARPTSNIFSSIISVLSALPTTYTQLLRIKMNLKLPITGVAESSYGMPHVDIVGEPSLISAIYYVNDSDGNTVIFNQRHDSDDLSNLTVKKIITPKRGRLVVFDGNLLHSSNTPRTSDIRIVINFNVIPSEEKNNSSIKLNID